MSDETAEMPKTASDTETVKKKQKQSSTILNILIIITGLFFLSKGILEFLIWLKVFPFPDWLSLVYSKLNNKDLNSALSFLGTQGILAATLGFWAFIAGILMFREEESGWGMGVVILSTIGIMSLTSVIVWITNPESFSLTYWPNWVTIFSVIIGFFGFFYLLITKKRYS